MHSYTPLLTAVLASLTIGLSTLHAQTALQNRFNEDHFRDSLEIDSSSPMFINGDEAEEYFKAGGKWKVSLKNDISFDTNPLRTPHNGQEDWSWTYGSELGYEWWVSQASGIVITPALSFGGQHYDTLSHLDGENLGTGVTFTFKHLLFEPELSYGGKWAYESGFGTQNYTEHAFGLAFGKKINLRAPMPSNPMEAVPTLTWRVAGGYQFTDPDSVQAVSVGPTVTLSLPVTSKLGFNLIGAVAYRSYAHDQPTHRDTWLAKAGANVTWKLGKNAALVLGTSYTHADDRINAKDFDQLVTTLSLKLTDEGFRFLGLPHYAETSAPSSATKSSK